MNLAQIIKNARIAKNVSQCELGRRIGINSQTLSDLERGKRNLPTRFVAEIAHELGIDECELKAAIVAFAGGSELNSARPK